MKTHETQDYLKEVYDSTGFFCTYSEVYQVQYSQAQGCYYYFVIGKKVGDLGLAKRGRVSKIDAETVHRWFEEGTIF